MKIKIKSILIVALLSFVLSGCGTFKKYEPQVTAPADIFGKDVKTDDSSLAQMTWREFT